MEIQPEDVHNALAPYLPALRRMVLQAANDYAQYSAEQRKVHTTRSKASLIHDHFFSRAKAFADQESGVRFEERAHLCMLVFDAGFVIRFKKVDRDLLPAGHHTQQVLMFRTHQQLGEIPRSINLDLSYEEDGLGKLRSVFLICPSGPKSNMWVSELHEAAIETKVVSLFGAAQHNNDEPSGAKITTKRRGKGDEAKSGNGDSGA
jgi:hypothetical protein